MQAKETVQAPVRVGVDLSNIRVDPVQRRGVYCTATHACHSLAASSFAHTEEFFMPIQSRKKPPGRRAPVPKDPNLGGATNLATRKLVHFTASDLGWPKAARAVRKLGQAQ